MKLRYGITVFNRSYIFDWFQPLFFNSKGLLVVLRFYVVEQVLLLLLFGGKQEEEHKIIDFSHKNQFMFVFWEEKQQIKFFVKMPVAKTAGVRAGRLFSIFLLISQIFFKVNTRTSLVKAPVIFFTQLWTNPLLNETLKNWILPKQLILPR